MKETVSTGRWKKQFHSSLNKTTHPTWQYKQLFQIPLISGKQHRFHWSVKNAHKNIQIPRVSERNGPHWSVGWEEKKMYQHHSKTTQNRLEATEHNYTTVLWNPGLKKCDFSNPDSYKIKFCIKSPKQTPSSLSRALYLFLSVGMTICTPAS